MQFLRTLIDKQRKLYHSKDSKFHKVWPLFDAFETFLFAPDFRAGKSRVHVRDYVDLKRVMNNVILAMVPCLLWAIWNNGDQHFAAITAQMAGGGMAAGDYTVGWLQGLLGAPDLASDAGVSFVDTIIFGLQRMLPLLIVSYGVGLGIEMMFSVIRKEEVSEGYLVSGMLIALIVPASTPLWQLAVGVAFAVILGKEVFGGTGMNIFNVAMMVRAFLFFSFPAQMSGDTVWVAGNDSLGSVPGYLVDGYSQPTPLAVAKQATDIAAQMGMSATDASSVVAAYKDGAYSHADMFFGTIPGSAGSTSKLCILLGAFWILWTGVGSWRTMLSGVIGVLAAGLLLPEIWAFFDGTVENSLSLQAWEHLLMGGFLFGIVFMATDPVSSPETNTGKWVYGLLIGVITVMVRMINPAYPEGVMLAIILLNAFAPTIDHFIVSANIKRRLSRA
ncbi:MAG: NADH:ubiquinone reductase (Na(+)-transporting) subunit B [Planctomycetota bacterium]